MVEIPEPMRRVIAEGKAVLFLGAGATIGAQHPKGLTVPKGDGLRDELCDKFLNGALKDRTLANVADIIVNEYSLGDLQTFVRNRFKDFEPADFHQLIPTFPWQSIMTTNYDLIVERAYTRAKSSVRTPEICVKDSDKIDVRLGEHSNGMAVYKLHGCIDHYQDHSIPLILSSEQYARHKKNRRNLFHRMEDLAKQFTVVFCGYRLQDPNIQAILFDLADRDIDRPRFFLVDPRLTSYDQSYWEKNKFTCIKATFEEFLRSLENSFPNWKLNLPSVTAKGQTSLQGFFRRTDAAESILLRTALEHDLEHVHPSLTTPGCDPKRFYHGFEVGWTAMEQQLDARRRVVDDILNAVIMADPGSPRQRIEVYLLKGPAGNGKSVALRRLAWDAGVELRQLVLFLRDGGALDFAVLEEIHDLTGLRILLFVDRAALRADELLHLIQRSKGTAIELTIFLAERDNEWNVYCESLDRHIHDEYPVHYLSEIEVERLLDKLESHNALGYLSGKTRIDQKAAFMVRAQRQLLVALHETTLGEPFEKILVDEYSRLVPDEAKQLYLDVCTLNRLAVPVRAGLISRAGGLDFSEFKQRFTKPLEHVVRWTKRERDADAHYSARHPHIAQVVFEQVLQDKEDRLTQLARILGSMNLTYTSDQMAFEKLTKAAAVEEALDIAELGYAFYERARAFAPEDVHVAHQFAVFALRKGDTRKADQLAGWALEQLPRDRSILHTVANIRRRQARDAQNPLEKKGLREASRKLLARCRQGNSGSAYDAYLEANLVLDELEELLKSPTQVGSSSQRTVEVAVSAARMLSDGQRRYTESQQLLMLEHRLRSLLGENDLAARALKNAFELNPRQEYVATLLARALEKSGEAAQAVEVLEKCLSEKDDAKEVHFFLGRLLIASPAHSSELGLQHIRKSFTPRDDNYGARLFYARELILNGRKKEADEIFAELRTAALRPREMSRPQYIATSEDGSARVFDGTVVSQPRPSYCFLKSNELPCEVFCHASMIVSSSLASIAPGDRLTFNLGVSMQGPVASKAWLGDARSNAVATPAHTDPLDSEIDPSA
jgi:hypothetical protein